MEARLPASEASPSSSGSSAIAMGGDVAGGLARMDALAPALQHYHYYHSARADLLRRLDAREAAADAYARALDLAGNAAERAFLERRLAEIRTWSGKIA